LEDTPPPAGMRPLRTCPSFILRFISLSFFGGFGTLSSELKSERSVAFVGYSFLSGMNYLTDPDFNVSLSQNKQRSYVYRGL